MALHIPALIEMKVSFDVQHVEAFRDSSTSTYEEQLQSLSARAKALTEDDPYMDALVDEKSILDEVVNIAHQMAVVALYRVVELNTGKVVRRRWKDAGSAELYRVDKLRKRLRQALNVDLDSLSGFAQVDELRCANNAVKHDGRVSTQLAQFTGWTVGEPLQGLDDLFRRAAGIVPTYLKELAEVVVPRSDDPHGT